MCFIQEAAAFTSPGNSLKAELELLSLFFVFHCVSYIIKL